VKIWKLLTTALVLTSSFLGFTAPASAGGGVPPCGSICDGKDPNTFNNCASDAVNVLSPAFGLQLRYSNHCETTWGRFAGNCSCQVDYFEIRSYFLDGVTLRAWSRDRAPTNSSATVMLNDHNLLNQACISYSTNDGATHEISCTGKY
jgi:hypothetical protein